MTEGPGPSDSKVQIAKLKVPENRKNVAVNDLVDLVVTRMKAKITLFVDSDERDDLLKIFEELKERKSCLHIPSTTYIGYSQVMRHTVTLIPD